MPRCWKCKTQVSSREETCPVCDSDLDERTARREQKKSQQKVRKSAPAATNALKSSIIVVGVIFGGFVLLGLMFVFGMVFLQDAADMAAEVRQLSESLPNIGRGLPSYHSAHVQIAPHEALRDETGKARHSWMAALLPYIDQAPAYNKIVLTKPWSDPENREIYQTVILGFRYPLIKEIQDEQGFALAHYTGNSQLISAEHRVPLTDITDGLSNTALAGTVNAGFRPWGDPANVRDLAKGIGGGPECFGRKGKYTLILMADGSVRQLTDDTSPDVLRAMASPNDGK